MAVSQQSSTPARPGPLAGYRILDLADEKGQLCARLLGELGAEVIKIEPRDGDPTRNNGPFFRGEPAPDMSVYWWAMNAGKRSITCELRLEPGRDLFRQLIAQSDMLIETATPGEMAALGLGYEALRAVNPALVMVSITNFGQSGPYSAWHATDIVGSAMGGQMYLNGDPERGPVRTTAPQAYAQANFQAAVGAMTALYARAANDGRGQHVDVSMQESMTVAMDNNQPIWDLRRINPPRPGVRRNNVGVPGSKYLFETIDGWVAAMSAGGLIGVGASAIIDWLAGEGEARGLDAPEWRQKLTSLTPLDPAELAHVEKAMTLFCRTRGKEELVAEAQRRGAGWAPVFGPRELVESKQLAAREFWVRVVHEDIGESFIYPGAPFKLSTTPWSQGGRAPHIGEHNEQVYGELLGLEPPDLRRLKMRMVL